MCGECRFRSDPQHWLVPSGRQPWLAAGCSAGGLFCAPRPATWTWCRAQICTAVTHTNARGSGNVRGTNPLCCTHNPLCRLDVQLEYSSRVIRAILCGGQELQAAARPVLEAWSEADEQSLLPVLELGVEASKVGSV